VLRDRSRLVLHLLNVGPWLDVRMHGLRAINSVAWLTFHDAMLRAA
jgi:hypothetical protein